MICVVGITRLFLKKRSLQNTPLYIVYQDVADVDNLYSLLLLGRALNVSPNNPMRLVLMPRLVDLSVPPFDAEREKFDSSTLLPHPGSRDVLSDSDLIFKDSVTRIWLYLHKALGNEERSKPLRYTMDCVRIYKGDYPIGAFAPDTPSLAAISHKMHAHDYLFFRADLFGGVYGDVITPGDYQSWLQCLRDNELGSEVIRREIENGFELFESRSGSRINTAIRSIDELHREIKMKYSGYALRLVLLAQASSLVRLLEDRNLLRMVDCIYAQFFTWSHSDNVLGEQFNIILDRIAAGMCMEIVKTHRIPFYTVTTQYPNSGNAPLEFVSRLARRNSIDTTRFYALRELWNALKGGRAQTIFDIWVVALIFNTHLFKLSSVNLSLRENQFQLEIDSTKTSNIFVATNSSLPNSRLLVDWMENNIF